MRKIFERFVRNFYDREQLVYRVRGGEPIKWQQTVGSPTDLEYLPRMVTDVTLESASRKLVIDTKYYASTLQSHYDTAKVHSSHIYQLFAYLQNFAKVTPGRAVDGMLLYPTVDVPLDLKYTIHGHHVRVATVNLDSPWKQIHERLLALLSG